MFGKILCLTLVVSLASAAVMLERNPSKPAKFANKEGCYIRSVDDVIPYGSEITPIGNCVRISCGTKFINYATCGVVVTNDSNCHVTEIDPKTSYPDCCPKIKCDVDNNLI